MSEPIRTMADLVEALRQRRDELDISHETIDEISGLQSGYSGKLLAPRAPRNLSYNSLGLILGALGVGLEVVEDPEQIARVAKRWQKRKPQGPRYKAASAGPAKRADISEIIEVNDLFAGLQNRMRMLGRAGGKASGKTRRAKAERRRDLRAKRAHAARIRWAKEKSQQPAQ
jgi:hypothetical protein